MCLKSSQSAFQITQNTIRLLKNTSKYFTMPLDTVQCLRILRSAFKYSQCSKPPLDTLQIAKCSNTYHMNEYITESFKVAVLKKEIVGKPLSN
jgi:hypothetical protein